MRWGVGGALVVMAVAACARSAAPAMTPQLDGAVEPEVDAGSADAATVAVEPPGSGTMQDAGNLLRDAGVEPDAGVTAPDAGGDGGTRLGCAPSGELVQVWSLMAPVDRVRPNDTYQSYYDARSDSAGGVFVAVGGSAGHSAYGGFFTVDREGTSRIPFATTYSCHPAHPPCLWEAGPIAAGGFLFGPSGGIASALDGGLVAAWDGQMPLTPDGGTFRYDDALAADGHRSVFTKTDIWAGNPVETLVTQIGLDGGTAWQRVFEGGFVRGLELDEGGTTHLLFDDREVALDVDGGTLFTAALPSAASHVFLAAGGGRLYLSGRTLLDARTGAGVATLPFEPIGPALLTPSRILVQENLAGAYGPLHGVDLGKGSVAWTRDVLGSSESFRIAGEFVLVLDPDRVLHFVDRAGRDALACQLPADAQGAGVLLEGVRLVVPRGSSVDAYDLPIPLDGG